MELMERAITELVSPGPNVADIAIASTIPGIACSTSRRRMMSKSAFPPKYPAREPKKIPPKAEIKTAISPILKEYLLPYNSLEKISLPSSSVPKIYAALGFWSLSVKCASS